MNAYELADELLRDNTQLTVKAAYMLRQQADRIAELEEENALLRKRFGEELDGHHSALHRLARLRKEMMRQKGMESND